MNLNEFELVKSRLISELKDILRIEDLHYRSAESKLEKQFYSYSIKVTIAYVNTLLMGEVKLNTQFRNTFESKCEDLFKSSLDMFEEKDGEDTDGPRD